MPINSLQDRVLEKLLTLYGVDRAPAIFEQLQQLLDGWTLHDLPPAVLALTERDVVLITYGDQVRPADGTATPLATLHDFLKQTIAGTINTVHLLPFYPYTSDDGFSVVDYTAVDPALGTWEDIRHLSDDFRLMFDAVFNHISQASAWFQGFRRDAEPYNGYFMVVDQGVDLSQVRRPRTLPLLTEVETARGKVHVWTTFSPDQIDVNIANPAVLLDLIRILLFYVEQGATLIRLDAIGFLWKTIGTECIHLPETHLVIRLMRDVLDLVAPEVILVTETNVPHDENISYFGDGDNEAQMVYQFTLPPLLVHTFQTGDTSALNRWTNTIHRPGSRTTYFNFTASHDGIGVTPATGILSPAEIGALVERVQAHGGLVSYKSLPDGTSVPYELNISYFDAINHPEITAAQPEVAVQRFIASQAIMLAFMGVPGIYFHSLFGSRSDHAGVQHTGRNRTINRQKFEIEALLADLNQPDSLRRRVFEAYTRLLRIRTQEPAFHPLGQQTALRLHPGIYALDRRSPDGLHRVLALHNVREETIPVHLAAPDGATAGRWRDLLTDNVYDATPSLELTLSPGQVAWLKAEG